MLKIIIYNIEDTTEFRELYQGFQKRPFTSPSTK